MKLVPRTDTFRRRLNYLVVKLDKRDFFPAVAGGGRQERRKQCIRHRRKLDESEDSARIRLRYTNQSDQPRVIERSEIETLIPHRPPFLWIDRVEELEPGVRCVAVKFVDPANPIFAGHFPARPILPGVFLIEAVAQTAGVMLGSGAPQAADRSGKEWPCSRP